MVNWFWFLLVVSGILVAMVQGKTGVITTAILDGAKVAVETSLGLIAIITFWLGVMRVAEAAGIVAFLARLLKPFLRFLFPSIPPQHPAMGAIILNLSANLLGLGNAATPAGLLAMREMQKLNPRPEEATPAMCTFLALNTACVTLIPTTIIGVRALYGSQEPAAIIGTTVLATACGTIVAVVTDALFRRFYRQR
ncbi:nucleoside recognition domain protein [Ammonifex degensii KC4]|uniref:Nucleoside recognition domain protein n=1 Tax=Ammonifex degensii (strain DSM 10501 / KC4) TaxID=429009 RepID=C9R7X5_AMMDK|nr:nucleoside recognition domain-containing protein [Ammonifex degensii]ACX52404.1 nucleoside recognition domain protein [Ammonifex degensii KC4]